MCSRTWFRLSGIELDTLRLLGLFFFLYLPYPDNTSDIQLQQGFLPSLLRSNIALCSPRFCKYAAAYKAVAYAMAYKLLEYAPAYIDINTL